ncbi:hypothetical protein ACNPON_17485 [Glutamicibacter sp. AGC13]
MNTIEPGMTCRLGKAKTAVQWEVIDFKPQSLTVQLSKLGGDGYVNKWSTVQELIDLQPRLLPVTLASVLAWQEKVRNLGASLSDTGRFFANSGKCVDLASKINAHTEGFHKAVAGDKAGIQEHYPHLIQKEN